MASKKELEDAVKTVFATLLALFNGLPDTLSILQAHLQTSYNYFLSEGYLLAETWTKKNGVQVAAYAILRTPRSEFQQLLLIANNNGCLLYIAFLLGVNHRKYIRSIVCNKNWRKIKIIMQRQNVIVKDHIKEHLQGI